MSEKRSLANQVLIRAFKEGDMNAYAHLMRKHQEAAHRIAFAFTKDEEKSAELVIVVFMRLWNKRESIPEGASIIAYLSKFIREVAA
jgi:DNA-directed RNA polymerase specialized sigma24 family protein